MKTILPILSIFLASSIASAAPVVGVQATYDFRREVNGVSQLYTLTKEVLAVYPATQTYSEKSIYRDGAGSIVLQGVIDDQPYDQYEITDLYFIVKCATERHGKSIGGVGFSYERVTVPAGTYPACRISYVRDGLNYVEYLADDIVFTSVKTVLTDPVTGTVRTSELRSVNKPEN